MTEGARPLEPAEIAARLAPWIGPGASPRGAVLAVSGGPDSTALMGCAALLPPARPVVVATVDHGLRPASAAEAEGVARVAGALGLPHRTLAWPGPKPATRLQAAAREARYALLAALAREVGAGVILTAHTLDDQAETVLMRLCAGSGPAGLAGMAPARPLRDVVLARPFLDLPKARLVATCEARAWAFVRDPANDEARFGRARMRSLLPLLAPEGLTPERLGRLAARARRTQDAIEAAAGSALRELRRDGGGEGGLLLDGAGFLALPEAVALRVAAGAIAAVAGCRSRPLRLERLEEALLGQIRPALARGEALRRTLGGVLLEARRDGMLRLAPEPARGPGRSAGS
ncbi:tRNA(Ile)-lysidine synthase [Methylobacterium crusticola]|uniref:tRNA(Ile)-lysidine synthase n=1 Tax=Methylobacterium crusticola TaxID=1697972 RepID=A0ABQ4QW48_9HYPH|nr:tRNA lysidine(34) synthetase TilS [Methylobacterium crusticola]GJD49503.1 tRNA(Ile)-lysidine synthase [Methylobacterium crusticola]